MKIDIHASYAVAAGLERLFYAYSRTDNGSSCLIHNVYQPAQRFAVGKEIVDKQYPVSGGDATAVNAHLKYCSACE